MARHFNHRRKETACSSQDPVAYNEKLQQLIFFRAFSSVYLFQSNQRFQVIEFVD